MSIRSSTAAYPLVTTSLYEKAWSALSVADQFGTSRELITRQCGVAAISHVRSFPGSRERFAELFPQGPMHDLGEVWRLVSARVFLCVFGASAGHSEAIPS